MSVFSVANGLWKGLRITFRTLFMPTLTVQYPVEKLTPSPRFRGALDFHPDRCISCEMCVRACPSRCISLASQRNETTGKKDLQWYRIDIAKCHHCQLCEEACPTKPKAVHHTRDYELTFDNRSEFVDEWTPQTLTSAWASSGPIWSRFLTRANGEKKPS